VIFLRLPVCLDAVVQCIAGGVQYRSYCVFSKSVRTALYRCTLRISSRGEALFIVRVFNSQCGTGPWQLEGLDIIISRKVWMYLTNKAL
jgi:hypothetical protein